MPGIKLVSSGRFEAILYRRTALGLLAGLLLSLSGCQSVDAALVGWLISASEPAQEGSELAPIVLFQDDFSDLSSGWRGNEDPGALSGYADGAYRFTVTRPDWYFWATPGLDFGDLTLGVQATRLGGDHLSMVGAICRYRDPGNLYYFGITSDRYYAVGKRVDDQETLLGMAQMQADPAIMEGDVSNHLKVSCIGDRLSLTVNGVLMAEVRDSTFERGDVGLLVSALGGQRLDVAFDNLTVLAP